MENWAGWALSPFFSTTNATHMASKGVRTLNIAIAGAGVVGGGVSRARNDFIARVGRSAGFSLVSPTRTPAAL
jgi:hypothetical protein